MGSLIGVLFFGYSSLLFGLVTVGYFLQRRKEGQVEMKSEKVEIDDLTVIVPFRNERERIPIILSAINNSSSLPALFIFVDDHSTDNTSDVICAQLENKQFRIIQLPDGQIGKKQAIREAMKQVETKWVLSMDADIHFSPTYFQELNSLFSTDATVLPILMQGQKWYHRIYELDVLLINAINAGITGWRRPIIASGANLLYKKSAFETYDRFEQHKHMPSGDDIYLLRDFRNGGAMVNLSTNPLLAVVTETPQSFKEFIHQRLRWIAKTGDVGDHLSTTLSLIQAFFTFFFFGVIVYSLLFGLLDLALMAYCMKTAVDLVAFYPYFSLMSRLKSWMFIPVYELFFPLYSLLILLLMYTFRPVWRGRKLARNF
jgi:cellulose synthase/poly-beta-1,6-N-acetylglucosamine synthase-like glycosyltransferase